MIYHVPKANDDDVRVELNFLRRKYTINKQKYSIVEVGDSIPRFAAFNPSLSIFEIKKKVAKQLRGIFNEDPFTAEEATFNSLMEIQFSLRNMQKMKNGKLAKELIVNDIDVNESAENAK